MKYCDEYLQFFSVNLRHTVELQAYTLQKQDGYFNTKCLTSVACVAILVIDNLMASEQTLRGEPTRHIPYTLYNYVVISIQGYHVRVYGKHVRSNYIITQLVNYGDENLQVE